MVSRNIRSLPLPRCIIRLIQAAKTSELHRFIRIFRCVQTRFWHCSLLSYDLLRRTNCHRLSLINCVGRDSAHGSVWRRGVVKFAPIDTCRYWSDWNARTDAEPFLMERPCADNQMTIDEQISNRDNRGETLGPSLIIYGKMDTRIYAKSDWRKWHKNRPDSKIVLIVDPNSERGKWPVARVTKVFMGTDYTARSAEVETTNYTYLRPTSKLCLIESTTVDLYTWRQQGRRFCKTRRHRRLFQDDNGECTTQEECHPLPFRSFSDLC